MLVKNVQKLNMRLPTRNEMESAFKNKTTAAWKKDGYWFWTSDEYSKVMHIILMLDLVSW